MKEHTKRCGRINEVCLIFRYISSTSSEKETDWEGIYNINSDVTQNY